MAYKDGDIVYCLNTNVLFAYKAEYDELVVSRYPSDFRLARPKEVKVYEDKFEDSDSRYVRLEGTCFYLDDGQMKKYEKWRKSLPKLDSGHFGAIGGGTSFTFSPTGLGDMVEVVRHDNPKKHRLDLTDSESW